MLSDLCETLPHEHVGAVEMYAEKGTLTVPFRVLGAYGSSSQVTKILCVDVSIQGKEETSIVSYSERECMRAVMRYPGIMGSVLYLNPSAANARGRLDR